MLLPNWGERKGAGADIRIEGAEVMLETRAERDVLHAPSLGQRLKHRSDNARVHLDILLLRLPPNPNGQINMRRARPRQRIAYGTSEQVGRNMLRPRNDTL
jgi:hypothetical protein